jgi:hypothetical protein
MPTAIFFDKDHMVTVDHPIQEVYDSLVDAKRQGFLVSFMEVGTHNRMDVNPDSVLYLRDYEAAPRS